jgi:hypothetical protein
MNTQKNNSPLEYQLISKKLGTVVRYYMRSPYLTSDILISKQQALDLVAEQIPSIENTYHKIESIVDAVVEHNSNIDPDYFPSINDIEDDYEYVESEDIDDIGDTIVHATVSRTQLLESPIEICDQSPLLSQSTDLISTPTVDLLLSNHLLDVTDNLEETNKTQIELLKKDNSELTEQNQSLKNQLANLESEQEKISSDMLLLEEVNSNLRSQLSTYKSRMNESGKQLDAISAALETSMAAFQESQNRSKELEQICLYQDEELNKLSDRLLGKVS